MPDPASKLLGLRFGRLGYQIIKAWLVDNRPLGRSPPISVNIIDRNTI